MYIGTCVPWMAIETKFSKHCIICNLDKHLYAQLSKWALWLYASLIASRHLVDRLSFCSWIWWVVPRYLLDTSAIDDLFLDTSLDNFLDTSRYLHLSSFIEGLYIHFFAIWFSFLRSLDLSAPVHLPNTISLTPNLFFCDFSSFSKFFLLLVSF